MTKEEMQAKFKEITLTSVPEQAKYFLREFVGEFVGKFDDVLTLSEEFMVAAGGGARDSVQELDEQQAHIFLEKRGEPITVKDMRDRLREIDLDMNHKVAFIEYMMFSSKKTLAELFADKPENMKALLAKLDEAIDSHNAVLAKRKAEADKEKELDELSKGTGVKALKAKAELEQLRARRQTALNMAEARAAALKRKAQKELDNGDPMAEEMKKLEIEKKQQAEAEAAKAADSKQRLADRAAMFSS